MNARVHAETALLTDVGSAWTKATLVAHAAGRWRICAHASQPTSWGWAELRDTLTGRIRDHVDSRLTDRLPEVLERASQLGCHTPRRPGRLALAAVSSELSAPAARRAAESAGWVVVEEATSDDGRPLSERLAALQSAEVDAWLLAGGFDDGRAEQAIETAALAAAARGADGGPVIWAGSRLLAEEVVRLFPAGKVTIIANPRPTSQVEDPAPLRRHLEQLLEEVIEPERTIQLTPVSLRRAIAELARGSGLSVLGVDIGARYATWARADASGRVEARVFAAGGLTAPALTASGAPARLARSLGHGVDELAVADTLQNLRARPEALPQTDEELLIVQAAARQQLAQIAGEEGGVTGIDLIVGCGRTIAAAPHPGHAMQILLDGLRPLGVVQLAIDPAGALGPLGAMEDDDVMEGIGTLRDDLLVPIGAALVCRGGRPGHVAMRVRLLREGAATLSAEVRTGQLQALPLARGQRAELEIELEGGASLGLPGRVRRARARVSGGPAGVVLDARDIPLLLPRRAEDRRAIVSGWRAALLREPFAAPPPDGRQEA
jgi:hypothetical protein